MPKLTQMNIPQLKKACREKGICGVSKMNKKELRKALATTMGDIYEFKENNDILFLILSKYIPEMYWCQVSQISKTYNKVMREAGFSPWYCMCPRCEALVHKGEYNTEIDILWQPVYDNKDDYVTVLEHLLIKVENVSGYINRTVECYDIFSSIARNKWIFDYYTKFKDAVYTTLIKMIIDKNIDVNVRKMNILLGKTFLPIIFPEL